MSEKIAFNRSRIFFYFQISFIFGVLIGSFYQKSWTYIPAFFIPIFFSFVFKGNKKTILSFLILAFAFSAGMIKVLLIEIREPAFLNNYAIGIVSEEPRQRERSLSFILESGGEKIMVTTGKYADIGHCDKVSVTGDIKKPEKEYSGFLLKDGVRLVSFFPEIEVIERRECKSFVSILQNKAEKAIKRNFSFPQSAFLKAMLLGQKHKISDDWNQKLSSSGIRHIVAVSGMHISVIGMIFSNIALGMGFKKKRNFLLTVSGIIFFIITTGAQPSAIRAGIMGGTALLARLLGRMNSSFKILILAAFVMLFFNPLLLRHDIGFQLSFTAVSGIIVFSRLFKDFFKFLPKIAGEIMATSFSAYIFSFPFLVYYFKEISIVFPITNILILPILYPIMFLGILFVFFSFFMEFIAEIIAIPLSLLLSYVAGVVGILSKFSWSVINPGISAFILYILVLFYLFKFKFKSETSQTYS